MRREIADLSRGKLCLEIDLTHLGLTVAQQARDCLDDLADLRLDGRVDTFRHEIGDQIREPPHSPRRWLSIRSLHPSAVMPDAAGRARGSASEPF